MTTLRIPAPLRPYAEGASEIEVQAENVDLALTELTERFPAMKKHLFLTTGELRAFIHLFVNDEDIRHLDGVATPLKADDRLMLVPRIAGGSEDLETVDHAAIRVNQAFVITLAILAFIVDMPWLAAFVGGVMFIGTLLKKPGFGFVYQFALKPLGLVRPEVVPDNPEPHRFAQGFGSLVLLSGAGALFGGLGLLGWALVWLVAALAALNLFGGFCVGCAMYYWLSRLNVPGFEKSPPPGIVPGMRPKVEAAE